MVRFKICKSGEKNFAQIMECVEKEANKTIYQTISQKPACYAEAI